MWGGTAEPFPQSAPGEPAIEKFDSNGRLAWQLGGGSDTVAFDGVSSDGFGDMYVASDTVLSSGQVLGFVFKASADVGEPLGV